MKSGRRKESRKEKSSVVKWLNEAGAKAVAVDMFMQAATHTRSNNTHISSTHTLSLSLTHTHTPLPQTVITADSYYQRQRHFELLLCLAIFFEKCFFDLVR